MTNVRLNRSRKAQPVISIRDLQTGDYFENVKGDILYQVLPNGLFWSVQGRTVFVVGDWPRMDVKLVEDVEVSYSV